MYKRLLRSIQTSKPESQTLSSRNHQSKRRSDCNREKMQDKFKPLAIAQHKRVMSQSIDNQQRKNIVQKYPNIQDQRDNDKNSLSGSMRQEVVKSISNFLSVSTNAKGSKRAGLGTVIRQQRKSMQFDVGKRRAKLLKTILGKQRFKKQVIQQERIHEEVF